MMASGVEDRKKTQDLSSAYRIFLQNRSVLVDIIEEIFKANAFDNRYILHPRQMLELAHEEADSYLGFLNTANTESASEYGRERLRGGLGVRTISDLGNSLRQFCWDHLACHELELLQATLGATDLYMASYIEGYMAECEAQILGDQEQMRLALSAALERQRRELRIKNYAVDTSINGIMLTDLQGYVTYVNEAFLDMWGYSELDQVLGESSDHFLKTDESLVSIPALADSEEGWRGEHIGQRKDGSTFQIEISASLIKDDMGCPIGIMASLMDVTERKLLEAEIQEAQKTEAIATLAGGIAHDFNNLLTTILGNTSLMIFETDPKNPHFDRLKTIEQQVHSGSKLTRQLLGYARKGRYEVTSVDLNQLVTETSETFARTRKELTIHRKLEENLHTIIADQGQLEQVLLNLYINAADAMSDGGELTLETANISHQHFRRKLRHGEPSDYVMLSVRDTGMGMDKDTLQRIFEPFFTTKQMGRGTGLGLATVYGIIKGHKGHIEVDSTKGQGTTFTLYFPASTADIPEAQIMETSEQVLKGTESILLVDDEEPVLEASKQMIKALGHTVFIAKSGPEAVEIFRLKKEEIDLVILDMIMPGMGGGDTYDMLKQIRPDVKVLLASGYSMDDRAYDIINRGCNGFIQKPLDFSELSIKIREILDKK